MIIGMIGGVGSGKSAVLEYLKNKYNWHVILADDVAKNIINTDQTVLQNLKSNFSEAFVDGKLDRSMLANIVFYDDKKLELLNSITHPATIKAILNEIELYKRNNVVVESAILIESGMGQYMDQIWYVYTELNTRVDRLKRNRGYSKDKTLSIINNQLSDNECRKYSKFVIDNSYNLENTYNQIDNILSVIQKEGRLND